MIPVGIDLWTIIFIILMAGIVNYALSTMLAEGRGFFDIFYWMRQQIYLHFQEPHQKKLNQLSQAGDSRVRYIHPKHWLYDGATCPVCVSFWVAIPMAIVIGWMCQLHIALWIVLIFLLHGIARFLYRIEN